MNNFFSISTPDGRAIKIYSNVLLSSTHPVLVHYINSELKYIYTLNGNTYVINGVTYSKTPGVSDLNFVLENTSYGSLYSFTINNNTINVNEDIPLQHGIHTFYLYNQLVITDIKKTGTLIRTYVDCCVYKKLNKVISNACDFNDTMSDINNIYAYVEAINSALSLKMFSEADEFYKLVLNICNSKCRCGC